MNALMHALLALEHLPADPAELRRDDLPTLLAAVRGQRRIFEEHRTATIIALVAGDFDRLRALNRAEERDLDVAYRLVRPYCRRLDEMAREPEP